MEEVGPAVDDGMSSVPEVMTELLGVEVADASEEIDDSMLENALDADAAALLGSTLPVEAGVEKLEKVLACSDAGWPMAMRA